MQPHHLNNFWPIDLWSNGTQHISVFPILPSTRDTSVRLAGQPPVDGGPAAHKDFFFFILKNNKNFKNICPFWIISKIPPGRPPIGRQAFSVIFFSSNSQRCPWRKKKRACRPPNGRQAPVARGGGGRQGLHGRHMPPLPLSFETKNSGKKLECLPCCHIFFKWWKNTTIGSRMSGQRMRHLGNPWSPCWVVATCDLVLAARYTMVPILSYSSFLAADPDVFLSS